MTILDDKPLPSAPSMAMPTATAIPIVAADAAFAAPGSGKGGGSSTVGGTDFSPPPPQHSAAPHISVPSGAAASSSSTTYPLQGLGNGGCKITCPHCARQGTTRTSNEVGCCTLVSVIVLFVLFWPLCWLPLVMDNCKDTSHRCEHCQRGVGDAPAECCN